ncbi:hypothetical protein L683_24895 [Pseudomonas aeruginosa WC55]|nr:hypothetical protein L683_24895 [Pseudomonas aeruginosa WC55]
MQLALAFCLLSLFLSSTQGLIGFNVTMLCRNLCVTYRLLAKLSK